MSELKQKRDGLQKKTNPKLKEWFLNEISKNNFAKTKNK
jgi:hypothetical protein